MKAILDKLIQHQTLSKEEARATLIHISKGVYNPIQIASFLTVYMMRSITVNELEGFRNALLDLCLPVDFSAYNPIDLCGTGGDGKDTFNISTLAAFVVAGAGIYVTKHGNYGVSSTCGSSNVLEHLGVKFSNNYDFLNRCLDTAKICILHAPLFHPAMKQVAPIRKSLGVKTFFNMLGPMVNPAFPKLQLVGVFNLELARMYGYLYQHTDKKYAIIHALDGYDEVSLTGHVKMISNHKEQMLTPNDFQISTIGSHQIKGGDTIASSAELFVNILNGHGTVAQNHVVCANAGLAIAVAQDISPKEGFEIAKASLHSGKALRVLQTIQKLSREN